MPTYNDVQLFGISVNDNSQFTKAVLTFMAVCLYDSPKVLVERQYSY